MAAYVCYFAGGVAEQEPGQVDRVRPEVAERPAAGHLLVVAPGPRGLGVDQPVRRYGRGSGDSPRGRRRDEPLRYSIRANR